VSRCNSSSNYHDEPESSRRKNRLRGINDYKVNLKAEIMIEDIHEKLDSILENKSTN